MVDDLAPEFPRRKLPCHVYVPAKKDGGAASSSTDYQGKATSNKDTALQISALHLGCTLNESKFCLRKPPSFCHGNSASPRVFEYGICTVVAPATSMLYHYRLKMEGKVVPIDTVGRL